MKEIKLEDKKRSEHKDFAPVEIASGLTLEPSCDIKDGVHTADGALKQGGKEIGRFTWNEKDSRVFLNVNTDGMGRDTVRSVVETVAAVLLQLIPETEDGE